MSSTDYSPLGLVDLDELTLKCRELAARHFIGEAVAAYRAGAYRSAIVATWNAVVFDFLGKLRELELSGEAVATSKLQEFEKIRAGGASMLKQALDFEREVLSVAASAFELLTPLEKADLERLHEDRNRCSHPSMQAIGEPYQPTAELARSHMRNAVEILLAREPLQGKAALERVLGEVSSEYFPKTAAEAKARFEHGPLRRARPVFVRNLLVVLMKRALRETCTASERMRVHAAIGGVLELHRAPGEAALLAELPRIAESVGDSDLKKVVMLCGRVPSAWSFLGPALQSKLHSFVRHTPSDGHLPNIINLALRVPDLGEVALSRVSSMTEEQFGLFLVGARPRVEFVSKALGMFASASSFRHSESLLEDIVLPLSSVLAPADIEAVLKVVSDNGQVWDAARIPVLLGKLFEATSKTHVATKTSWCSLRKTLKSPKCSGVWKSRYSSLDRQMKAADM